MKLLYCENPFETDRLNETGDFRPEWDVPSIGANFTTALDRDVDALRKSSVPNPNQKIHVLTGANGYGKTHLFGRIFHRHGEKIFPVFVPHSSEPNRAVHNVQWYLVEKLFHPQNGAAPLSAMFARILQPSFDAYFAQLPPTLQARHQELSKRLNADWRTVLEVFRGVTSFTAFDALANSVVQRYPGLQADVVRALVLGLYSLFTEEARVWLRGEELPEERCAVLGLGKSPPSPVAVVKAVATLLQELQTPLLICLDQVEALLLLGEDDLRRLTTTLMGWLHEIPNMVMVIGCLKDSWHKIRERAFESFSDRVHVHQLTQLTPAEARTIVTTRMNSWSESRSEQGEGWPFDLATIETFVNEQFPSPRSFIKVCSSKFLDWTGRRGEGLIRLGETRIEPLPAQFVQEWNRQLAKVKAAGRIANNLQEEEIWRGIEEAMEIARVGKAVPAGITLERIQPRALESTNSDRRPSAEIALLAGNKRFCVVVAATKKDRGVIFGHYVSALLEAVSGQVIGSVVVRPTAELGVGKTADSYKKYMAGLNKGKIRQFALDVETLSFLQLECLRQMIDRARAQDLVLGTHAVDVAECRKLVCETGVLQHLKLYEMIFSGWPQIEAVRVRTPEPAAVVAAVAPAQDASAQTATGTVSSPPRSQPPVISTPVVSVVSVAPVAPVARSPQRIEPNPPVEDAAARAETLLQKVVELFRRFGQSVKPVGFEVGPSFVRLKVHPNNEAATNKIRKSEDHLRLHLSLDHRPFIAIQAGYISIDVQRPDRQVVSLLPLLAQRPEKYHDRPAIPVGVDVAGQTQWLDLGEPSTCHILIAGTTGSGKSEFMKSILGALAHALPPDRLQLALIDPKHVTFNFTGESPYLHCPVAHDAQEALPLLEGCIDEMERRYKLMSKRGVEDITQLTGQEAVPRRVLIFDEFADLMLDKASKKETETHLKRLGAKARAAGIHLILGTQRTEASVVTPLLRSNLPGRISLRVMSERDSKLILETQDAAHLLGKGDLFWLQGAGLLRLQSPFVTKSELEQLLRLH